MNWNKKDIIRIILMLCSVVPFAYVLFNFNRVSSMLSWLLGIFMPFVLCFTIAFAVTVCRKALVRALLRPARRTA